MKFYVSGTWKIEYDINFERVPDKKLLRKLNQDLGAQCVHSTNSKGGIPETFGKKWSPQTIIIFSVKYFSGRDSVVNI